MKATRKDFLKTIGAGILGSFSSKILPVAKSEPISAQQLKLGIASYSFREFSLEETILMTNRLGIQHIALKSMHLPLDSSVDQIKEAITKVRYAGIDLYGAGVIYMKSKDEVNNAFAYAHAAGLKVIIGVPAHDLLPLVEKKVKEYDIKMAIHNHGPGDDLYSSPDDVYHRVKNLDKRVGLCLDIGHVVRIDQDPIEKARSYADRLHDVHFKDVHITGAQGSSIECGRGVMELPSFLEVLLEIKYSGIVALEYEKDGKDPLPGAAESIGYLHGILDSLA